MGTCTDEAQTLRNLARLCAKRDLDEHRQQRIREAMLYAGVGSIRVGRRVFECPAPSARLTVTVLPGEPGSRPAAQL